MIITRTESIHGDCRVYIGPKTSVECWIEPTTTGWQVKAIDALSGSPITDEEKRQCVIHLLLGLAAELNIHPDDLRPDTVPFETIEALHTGNPLEFRRMAVPRKRLAEFGYMATPPNTHRMRADFDTAGYQQTRRRS